MAWDIQETEGVAVVYMNSNSVNRQNPAFFGDLSNALDRLEARFAHLPVVLTSRQQVFSSGFDFDYWFPLIARRDVNVVQRSYTEFKEINLRLFSYPRPTIAAINGHAYAGGLITALCCDFRVAAKGDTRFSLNEVAIGLAMPSLFTEIIRYAVGTTSAAKATLSGEVYSDTEALSLGLIDSLTSLDSLLSQAMVIAKRLAPDCATAYAFSKEALQAPTLKRIREESGVLDRHFGETWCSNDAQSATARTYRALKER